MFHNTAPTAAGHTVLPEKLPQLFHWRERCLL